MKLGVKRIVLMAVSVTVLTALLFAVLYEFDTTTHAHSLNMSAGVLAANGTFLNSSRSTFQRCGWHLGDATKCWGNTYGILIGRFYWKIEVMHGRPEDCPQ